MNGNEKEKQNQWFDEIDERFFSFTHKARNWLKDVALEEEKASRHSSKRSSKSSGHSKKSGSSSRLSSNGSSKERAAVEKAKLAELMMEAEFLKKKQIIQNQAEKLNIEEKLAKAQARSQIFAAMKGDHSLRGSLMSLNKDDQHHDRKPPVIDDQNNRRTQHVRHSSRKYQHDDHTEQIHRRWSVNNDINKNGYQQIEGDKNNSSRITKDINKMMYNLLLHHSAPDVEIDTFKGDPLEYHYFMSLFIEAVEKKISDLHGRLVRLLKFTEGEAKKIIKHCNQQPPKRGYARDKILLEQHYRNPLRIVAAYRCEIKAWPLLKPSDSSGYKKSHNFLLKCESIMTLQHLNSMDTPEILCMLISKLPGNTRDRWNRKVLIISRQHRR